MNSFFFHQWQKKLVALFIASLLWIFVNQTIITTKTISSVPVRIVNLPNDHTVIGLLPNGFLNKRMTLTLTGTKDIIDFLEPGDLEVVVDVSNQPTEGALNITKKNLISLNPDINLSHHINAVDHIEYILKMSPTLTETVLVTILPPIGDPPENYDFLDIWPMTFTQTVTGPQDFVTRLKEEGLEIVFNLDEISKEELDSLPPEGLYDDIINFNVPASWKKIAIPLPGHHFEAINDPEAQNCYITFLRKKLLPIPIHLPVQVFYPLKNSTTINPSTYKLGVNQFIDLENEIPTLSTPLFANNVSQLFLEVVLDNLQLQIVAAPKSEREKLEWSICFVNQSHLEETYVAYLFNHARPRTRNNPAKSQERDTYLRHRFRNFLRHFTLYLSKQTKFELESTLKDSQVKVHVPNVTQAAATIEESY